MQDRMLLYLNDFSNKQWIHQPCRTYKRMIGVNREPTEVMQFHPHVDIIMTCYNRIRQLLIVLAPGLRS